MAGGGLLPRRDEHRQHEHPRAHHRLRTLPVPRRLRPGAHLQPQRYRRPLRLQPAAQRGLLEPALPGAGAAAADRRAGPGHRRARVVQDGVPARVRPAHGPQARSAVRRRARPRPGRRRAALAGRRAYRLDDLLAAAVRCRGQRRLRAGARPVHRPRRHRCLAAAVRRAARFDARGRSRHRHRHARSQPQVRAAEPPGPAGDRSGPAEGLRRRRHLADAARVPISGFEAYAGFPPDWASTIEISCSS